MKSSRRGRWLLAVPIAIGLLLAGCQLRAVDRHTDNLEQPDPPTVVGLTERADAQQAETGTLGAFATLALGKVPA